MKAIGMTPEGTEADTGRLVLVDVDEPVVGPRDVLVEVRGVSVNPVDVKMRSRLGADGAPHVLGFDAAGVVKSIGSEVQFFVPGDPVFYAGDLSRPGSNSERQVVDERIVGRKPESLGFPEAAALPLTTITAWEMLFDCFGLTQGEGAGEALLVIGGAGGVGSIMIQLAKALTELTVITTASRAETRDWVIQMGADHVVNHQNPLDEELATLGISPRYVASLTHTDKHFAAIGELIKPRGHIALIDDPSSLDILPLKRKAISVSWEFMFTRSLFQMNDMEVQGALLNRVSRLLDSGVLASTVTTVRGPMTPESLQQAHDAQASGTAIGKTVLGALSTVD